MSHKIISLLMVMGILTITACANKKDQAFAIADCVFPDDGKTEAPLWVCGAPFPNVDVSAVGSYEKTGAGIDFQKTMAIASARDFLARQFSVTVQGMVKQYAETTGAGDAETVDKVNSSVSKQITNETLTGSKMYISRVNPETRTLYVLVGMDDKIMKETAKQALATSMNNDNALWQQFKAKMSFEELAAEIAK